MVSWTLSGSVSSGAFVKAGKNVSPNLVSGGVICAALSDQAEGRICAESRRNWVDSYASLNTQIKNALKECVDSLIAMKMISYDMSGYSSKREAETMLDVNDEIYKNCLKALVDFKSNELKAP